MNRLLAILVVWVCGCLGVCSAMIHPGGPRDGACALQSVLYEFATPCDAALIGTTDAAGTQVSTTMATNGLIALNMGRWESTDSMGGDPNTNILVSTIARMTCTKPLRVGRRIIWGNTSGYEMTSPAIASFNPKMIYYPGGSSPITQSNISIGFYFCISNMPSPVFGNFDLMEASDQSGGRWGVYQHNINGNPTTGAMKYRSHSAGSPSAGSLVSVTNNVEYWGNLIVDLHAGAIRARVWNLATHQDLGVSSHTPNQGGNPLYMLFILFNDDHDLNPSGFKFQRGLTAWRYGNTNYFAPWPL